MHVQGSTAPQRTMGVVDPVSVVGWASLSLGAIAMNTATKLNSPTAPSRPRLHAHSRSARHGGHKAAGSECPPLPLLLSKTPSEEYQASNDDGQEHEEDTHSDAQHPRANVQLQQHIQHGVRKASLSVPAKRRA